MKKFFQILVFTLVIVTYCQTAAASSGQNASLAISCQKLGGVIDFKVERVENSLLLTIRYPKSIPSYLGGFSNGVKNYSADVRLYMDMDANRKTGLTADPVFDPGASGSEYSIEVQEITTSVGKDAEGNWITKRNCSFSLKNTMRLLICPMACSLIGKWKAQDSFNRLIGSIQLNRKQ